MNSCFLSFFFFFFFSCFTDRAAVCDRRSLTTDLTLGEGVLARVVQGDVGVEDDARRPKPARGLGRLGGRPPEEVYPPGMMVARGGHGL